jgi:16S rRNA (guanine527-N7)-methyltransferase
VGRSGNPRNLGDNAGMSTPPLPAAARADLDAGLAALGLDAALAESLARYLALMLRWNATYNLTAIRDPREMVTKHLLDSLAMVPAVHGVATLADLGTGPGLPGIPLAIAVPGLHVTLVESAGKKARFMREALRTLGLGNAEVAESRIEALDRPGAFQAITARALATLPQILALGGHLPAPDGVLLAMKGARPDDEIAALPPGWTVRDILPLVVPGLDAERHLVTVGRDRSTGA